MRAERGLSEKGKRAFRAYKILETVQSPNDPFPPWIFTLQDLRLGVCCGRPLHFHDSDFSDFRLELWQTDIQNLKRKRTTFSSVSVSSQVCNKLVVTRICPGIWNGILLCVFKASYRITNKVQGLFRLTASLSITYKQVSLHPKWLGQSSMPSRFCLRISRISDMFFTDY